MTMYFFAIPALDSRSAQDDFNKFCSAHRVVAIDRQFVVDGCNSYWALCVKVAATPGSLPDVLKAPERRTGTGSKESGSGRVDYKTVLSEYDFSLYAELRNWRKTLAEVEGVPVYAVFTNEQLAEIVRRRVDTLTALGDIEGIGPARIERYGVKVLASLQAGLSASLKK
jgi:superfamily II DNA helicase RecQ